MHGQLPHHMYACMAKDTMHLGCQSFPFVKHSLKSCSKITCQC